MAGWPGAQIQLRPLSPLYDPVKQQQVLMQSANMLARATRGAGGGGGTVGDVRMETRMVPDSTSPTGYRLEQFPKGSTEKDRAVSETYRQAHVAKQVFDADPVIAEKRARMQEVPVSERVAILDDIRRNDLPRLIQTTGLQSREVFDTLVGGMQGEVRAQQKEIEKGSPWSSSFAIGASSLMDQIASVLQGESAEKRVVRAQEHQEKARKITQEDAYLRERAAQERANMGILERIASPTGTLSGEIAAAMGEMLPSAAPLMAGGAVGALAGGALAGPVGALVGAVLGSAGLTSATAPQMAVERIVADPRVTDKVAAAEEAIYPAAISGAVEGAVGELIPFAGGPILRSLLSRGAAPGALRSAALRAAEWQPTSLAGRYVKGTGRSAAELAGMSAVGVPGQNIVFEQATGIPTDLTEGMSTALGQSILAAPVFGAAHIRRRRPAEPAKPTPEEAPIPDNAAAPPETPVTKPAGTSESRFVVGQARRSVKDIIGQRAFKAEDADAFIQSHSEWTPQQWTDFFEQKGVDKRFALPQEVMGLIKEAQAARTRAPHEAAVAEFEKLLRSNFTVDTLTPRVTQLVGTGAIDIATMRKILNATQGAKNRNVYNKNIRAAAENALKQAEERMKDGTGTQPGPEGGRAPEAPGMGPVRVEGEAAAHLADTAGDSGMAPNTPAATPTVAAERAAELTSGHRTIESGRPRGTPEPDIGQGKAPDGAPQAEGAGRPGDGTHPRPSADAAAFENAAASPRPGESPSEAVRDASRSTSSEAVGDPTVETVIRNADGTPMTAEEFEAGFKYTPAPTDDMLRGQPAALLEQLRAVPSEQLIRPTKRGVPSLGKTAEAAHARAMDLLWGEALGAGSNASGVKQLDYMRTVLDLPALEAPQLVLDAYGAAKNLGMNAKPKDIARAMLDGEDTYRNLIRNWSCGA